MTNEKHAFSEHVVRSFMNHPGVNEILKGKLHGGHFEPIHNRAKGNLNDLANHLAKIAKDPLLVHTGQGIREQFNQSDRGGSSAVAGSLHLGGNLKNHKQMYHLALELTPREFEMCREIAVQLLGGKPSAMWDKLTDENMEGEPEGYEHIYRMPNQHALAKLIEAEHGNGKRGGSIFKSFRQVAKIGSKIAKGAHHALGFVNRNKDLLLGFLPDKYKGEAEAFLETANKIDNAVNPIVDATIDAVKEGATKEDRDKLKRMAEDKIKQVVEEKVPKGKEIVQLAQDIKQTMSKPLYAE